MAARTRKKASPEVPELPVDADGNVIPPWALTEEQKADIVAAQEAPPPPAPVVELPKSNMAFGRLYTIPCPFHDGLLVSFHVGEKWGVWGGPVKDDDGKGMLRRLRMTAPYWIAPTDGVMNPLTEELIKFPDPQNLDSYEVLRAEGGLFSLWGQGFFDWLLKDGWEQAIEEAGGITPNE